MLKKSTANWITSGRGKSVQIFWLAVFGQPKSRSSSKSLLHQEWWTNLEQWEYSFNLSEKSENPLNTVTRVPVPFILLLSLSIASPGDLSNFHVGAWTSSLQGTQNCACKQRPDHPPALMGLRKRSLSNVPLEPKWPRRSPWKASLHEGNLHTKRKKNIKRNLFLHWKIVFMKHKYET